MSKLTKRSPKTRFEKYEELLRDRDGRIAVLEEQVKDASQTIATQKSMIDSLRIKGAG